MTTTGERRLRFVTLLSRALAAADLPTQPEFRAAIVGYAEWGTRLALHNSRPGAEPAERAPVPRWGWAWRRRIAGRALAVPPGRIRRAM